MTQQRETSTDRLANVIQVIQLGRKTGVLAVERGEDVKYEEGFIVFSQGQIVQAQVGARRGQDAFQWLSSWGECLFAFEASITPQTNPRISSSNLAPSVRPPRAPQRSVSTTSPFIPSVPNQTQSQPISDPYLRAIRPRTGPLPNTQPFSHSAPLSRARVRTPRSVRRYDDALQMIETIGLSRAHRRVFLLIDGKRSTPEIVRLMGRNYEEVLRLLEDLESAGIIYQQ